MRYLEGVASGAFVVACVYVWNLNFLEVLGAGVAFGFALGIVSALLEDLVGWLKRRLA